MKFGKEFRTHLEETIPEWRDKFLCYKPLKKLLKRFPNNPISLTTQNQHQTQNQNGQSLENNGDPTVDVGRDGPSAGGNGTASGPSERFMSLDEFQDWFVRLLNDELDKLNDFYVEKEEDYVIRFQELKERIVRVRENRRDGTPASESEFSEEMMDIRKEFVTIHGEMVLLKNYSSLNFAGLVKILKKYDKRTGGLLRLPFTQLAAHQPFFTTEPLTRLVRECEANLELLFPLEEEVTESTSAPRDQNSTDPSLSDITNIPPDTSSLGDATHDIYRSTLSAIRTIQGLRTSSTYNPLSFAVIFRDQNDEGSGAVTAENSPSNSNHAQVPTENEDTVDQGDPSSPS
ncbi:SPX domain-containing protein 4-like [Amaranthus tricolor]|uniref:SPX domain-containing protein 4-like n=1 Tax=Amaranthus tricolor TaxID=29722 RepID=UPI002587EC52|nr:SPX domain-containing protein 4-like [Amaranthus tricolor]